MNRYHILSFITAICNLILAVCFILFIDELNYNNLMLQYFLLYLLTMLITICLHKIGNVYEFNLKYPSTIKSK
jgi:hypothetical protein